MPSLPRRTAASCVAALALTGCANVSGSNSNAPAPASALPSAVASLVKTDVGQYFAKPRPGISSADVQATIDRLKQMPGVQSATLDADGRVDLQFRGGSTPEQRRAAVAQLAALGTIEEGV